MKIARKYAARFRRPGLAILIILVGGSLYLPSLHYNFIWDDMQVVKSNAFLRSPAYLPLFFQLHFWQHLLPISQNDYRPLQMVLLNTISLFSGRDPFLFRLANLLLHLLVCGLAYRLVKRLFGRREPALLTLAFFVFHPVHVETVVCSRNIAQLLAAALMLLSLGIFFRKSNLSRIIGPLVFFPALLCKESALIFPAILMIWAWSERESTRRIYLLRKTIPYWALAAAAGLGKAIMMTGRGQPPEVNLIQGISAASRLLLVYLKLLVFPVRLKVLYPFVKPGSWAEPDWFSGILAVLTLLVFAAYLLKISRPAGAAFFSLLISLIPALSVVGQSGRIVAEQRLYLPSFFFCLTAAILLDRLRSYLTPRAVFRAGIILICFWGALGIQDYLPSWKSNFSLWQRVAIVSPHAALARNNLAVAYYRRGEREQAVATLREALHLNPHHSEAHNNMGVYYREKGEWDRALAQFRESLDSDPHYHSAAVNLAELLFHLGERKKPLAIIRNVLQENPCNHTALNALGIIMEKNGKAEQALRAYQKAIRCSPEYTVAMGNLADYYLERRKFDKAIALSGKIISVQPGNPLGYQTLARIYTSRGDFKRAKRILRSGLKARPHSWALKSQLLALKSVEAAH
jgi:tetratricopeptide (TPR) repeat protein